MICWKCRKEISISSVTRESECPFCGCDLKTCKGCKFYSKDSHFECKESVSDPISDKERRNFCEYFSACTTFISKNDDKAKAAKDAFNALFG